MVIASKVKWGRPAYSLLSCEPREGSLERSLKIVGSLDIVID